ncbi:MAG: carboxypeptidase regulatory-like domain-containing protein [Chloroflexi bacterium]|nr:carboxypeptidase regulatory-like domain-containing protein [Chloroflexota bacterium]
MPNSDALNFERLVDWVDGRLSEEEAATVARQVATADEATQADLNWLRAFATASAATALAAPPPEVRAELIRRFETLAREQRGPSFFQRLIASLTLDSEAQFAATGLRSAGAQGSQRQLIYSTEIADIALNVQPRLYDKHLDITGQVFPGKQAASGNFSVQLLREAAEFGLTTTDELGEFAFEAIPPGVYEIVLSAEQAEILIAPVELNL